MPAKTQAERSRAYRERKRARAKAEGVTDNAPVLDQALALSRSALAQARVGLRKPGSGLVDEAKAAALTAERVVKIERDRGQLVDVEAVRRGWLTAMTMFGQRIERLIETLPGELRGRNEAAIRQALDDHLRGVVDELHRAPATWPVELGFER